MLQAFPMSAGMLILECREGTSLPTSPADASGCRCHGNPGRSRQQTRSAKRSSYDSSTIPTRPGCLGTHAVLCWSNQVMCGLVTATQRVALSFKNLCWPCPQTQCCRQVRIAQDQYAYYQLHGDDADTAPTPLEVGGTPRL